MDSYFRERRNVELSTLDFFTTQINANWTGITVVKSFAQSYKSPRPVVAIILAEIESKRREIGTTTLDHTYLLRFDIFAKSDGQRQDLSDFMLSTIQDGWTYSTYTKNPANAEALIATTAGRVNLVRVNSDLKLDFDEDGDVYDKYRHYIECTVRVSV